MSCPVCAPSRASVIPDVVALAEQVRAAALTTAIVAERRTVADLADLVRAAALASGSAGPAHLPFVDAEPLLQINRPNRKEADRASAASPTR